MIETKNLVSLFLETRERTETICKPLEIEDYVVQPCLDVSPPKWHLGHTTWFYEEFILKHHKPGYQLFHEDFAFVFNSYYESLGKGFVIRNVRYRSVMIKRLQAIQSIVMPISFDLMPVHGLRNVVLLHPLPTICMPQIEIAVAALFEELKKFSVSD